MTDRPVALITGGRRGIGRAIAETLARDGFDVAITSTREDEGVPALLETLRAFGGRAIYVASDLADLAAHGPLLDRVSEELGRLDCLVNNAGIGSPKRGDLLDVLPENFATVLDVNLRGTFFLTQRTARLMLERSSAGSPRSIVFVSSVSATMASIERGEYCLSKAALAMAVKLFALRLAADGIGVFEVRPGIIRTDMTAGVSEKYDRLLAEGLVPMRRWGEGTDVAAIVASLASGRLNFATGSVLSPDGGLSIERF
ncbi:MAG TPA: 3-ketoacyl-ACP reductase [Geminicoccaceae bacterium]|nr:3-ketoacyl-ACP reductase [Geminicoccaceae bacterium]